MYHSTRTSKFRQARRQAKKRGSPAKKTQKTKNPDAPAPQGNKPINRKIRERDYDSVLALVKTTAFNDILQASYKAKPGYAVGRIGPKKKTKVMVVAGSRNIMDWISNFRDVYVPAKLKFRQRISARRMMKAYRELRPDVVVGHSRGGAIVAKMDIPQDQKLGIDAAMLIADRGRKKMMNLYQKQLLDFIISRTGRNRKGYRKTRNDQYHFLTRSGSK